MRRWIGLLVVLMVLVFAAWCQGELIKIPKGVSRLEVTRLRSPETLKLIGRRVEFEGFFYNGSIPMLIDRMDRVALNLPVPEDSYVPIVGRIPKALKSGDKISLKGLLTRPTAEDGPGTSRESAVLRLALEGDIRVLVPVATSSLKPWKKFDWDRTIIRKLTTNYAVLIVGGIRASSNHMRYWNELKYTYNTLKSKGYTDDNIYVLYADGTGKDTDITVDFSATKANLATVFNTIAAHSSNRSTIYIMTNDHGGGLWIAGGGPGYPAGNYGGVIDSNNDEGDNHSEATLNIDINGDGDKMDTLSIDEVLYLWGTEVMTDDEFAVEVNKITNYSTMIIEMEQCFAGGFINDLVGPRRILMSACNDVQVSWAMGPNYLWNEFTYWYLAGWTSAKPDGTAGAVNADSNGNGKVSMLEAYNYARTNDAASEIPFYQDDGVNPGHSGAMPGGGEGTLGAATVL